MKEEPEPSVARWCSLLLGALAAAFGALVELKDAGYRGGHAGRYINTFDQACQMANAAYGKLRERRDELLADGTLVPILEAISLVADENHRLATEAREQAAVDIKFTEITDRLRKGGLDL